MKHTIAGIMLMAGLAIAAQACYTQHKIETVHHIQVDPMHITIDINVKVDKALDNFFGDLDKAAEDIAVPAKQ